MSELRQLPNTGQHTKPKERLAADLPGYPAVPLPSEAQTPHDLMESLYSHFSYSITYFRGYLAARKDLDDTARLAALNCLCEMEQLISSLQRRDPGWMTEQWRRAELLCILVIEIAVWADEIDSLKYWANEADSLPNFSRNLPGALEKWAALARAIVENELNGWKDWRGADSPIDWLESEARRIHKQIQEEKEKLDNQTEERDALYRTPTKTRERQSASSRAAIEKSLRFDAPERFRDTVPLDARAAAEFLQQVAHSPEEVIFSRRYAPDAVEQLLRAAVDDPELYEYITQMVRRGAKKRAVWRGLGWNEKKGERVDRRYRRLRHKIGMNSASWTARNEPIAGFSDASRNSFREPLYDGRKGTEVAEWTYKRLQVRENK